MKRPDPELSGLLERGRVIRRVPDVVRARAMARARAALAEARASAPALAAAPPRRRGLRLALAAAVCLAVGAAGATAALLGRTPPALESPPASRVRAFAPVQVPAHAHAPAPAPLAAVSRPISVARPRRPAATVARESYAVEFELLRRAQTAYAGRDFLVALTLLADHARRFPNGRLAEEREALRVRSLAGSGRMDEARHAVTVFSDRFPRSVLLPRLREVARGTE
jgi:hypothetical protein